MIKCYIYIWVCACVYAQVERWGMSDKVGYVSHKSRGGGGRGGGGGEVSEETRAAIDAEVVNDEF